MNKPTMIQIIVLSSFIILFSACQSISPIFVNYNGVRMGVAKWINSHYGLTMQQKRSLAQLSKAEQRLVNMEKASQDQILEMSRQHHIALLCAQKNVSQKKIVQLQEKVFTNSQRAYILEKFQKEFSQPKLDPDQMICE